MDNPLVDQRCTVLRQADAFVTLPFASSSERMFAPQFCFVGKGNLAGFTENCWKKADKLAYRSVAPTLFIPAQVHPMVQVSRFAAENNFLKFQSRRFFPHS
jgi:hypothetical protein